MITLTANDRFWFSVYDGKIVHTSSAWTDTGPVTQQAIERASSSSSCGAGHYSATESSTCTLCPAATFSYVAGVLGCVPCPSGKYGTTIGSDVGTSCQSCSAGSYSVSGSTVCSICTAGKYSSNEAGGCLNVPAGSYPTTSASYVAPNGTFDWRGICSSTDFQKICIQLPLMVIYINLLMVEHRGLYYQTLDPNNTWVLTVIRIVQL
jgi:hypothetical protein